MNYFSMSPSLTFVFWPFRKKKRHLFVAIAICSKSVIIGWFAYFAAICTGLYRDRTTTTDQPSVYSFDPMKLLNREEREAHATHVAFEGLNGLLVGSFISLGAFAYLKMKHPVKFKQFNTSIKACILIMPTVSCCAFYADQGSVQFDKAMRSSPKNEEMIMNRFREWKRKSTFGKIAEYARGHKLTVAMGTWAATIGGYYGYLKQDIGISETQRMIKVSRFNVPASGIILAATTAAIYADKTGAKKEI